MSKYADTCYRCGKSQADSPYGHHHNADMWFCSPECYRAEWPTAWLPPEQDAYLKARSMAFHIHPFED